MLHWSVTGGWKEGSHSTWNCPASQSILDCLDVYVLETAYYQYRSQYGELRSKSFYLLHQFIQQLTIILFMNGSDFLFIIRLVVFQTFSWFTGGTDTQHTICSVELGIPRTQGSSPSTLVLWQKYGILLPLRSIKESTKPSNGNYEFDETTFRTRNIHSFDSSVIWHKWPKNYKHSGIQ